MEAHRTAIADWIVRAALDGADEIAVLAGVCERLNALGLSLVRASVANNQLDPTHDARGVRWLRDQGGLEEAFERSESRLARRSEGASGGDASPAPASRARSVSAADKITISPGVCPRSTTPSPAA